MKGTAKVVVGGKHGALWERMKSKQRPQTIHRNTESTKMIPKSITMSPESSQEDELIGIQFDESVLVDMGKENQPIDNKEGKEPPGGISFVGTSFISASTQDDALLKESSSLAGTPMREPMADTTVGLTPGVCWNKWQQEEVDEADLSLMQHSVLSDESVSLQATPRSQTSEALLQAPIVQTPYPMTPGTELGLTASPSFSLTEMRRNSMNQALDDSSIYIDRIQELEEALHLAQAKAAHDSLDHDHIEKSHGTPAKSVSLKGHASSLLERNKTLIKEVRFAEQTCVELSQRNAALEKQVERLEGHLHETRSENESLHDEIVQANRECATLVTQKDALEVALSEERERRDAHVETAQTQLAECQTKILDLQQQLADKEKCDPALSPEKPRRSSSSSSPTSQVLAKTLQTQLERGYSDGDKILELEYKLAESQKALSDARKELESARAEAKTNVTEADRSAQVDTETSTCSMSTELELARAHAKLASVSKELQMLRVAESSSRHALSQAKLQLGIIQREKDELMSNADGSPVDNSHRQELNELRATVQKLTQECYEQEQAALQASNRVKDLEQDALAFKEAAFS